MTDLHDKARALLALRIEATPAPWAVARHGHGDSPWLIRPSVAYEIENGSDAAFMCAAHDMADTIRDLLAENERLTNALAAQIAATNGASAYAVEQAHRAEAAEARFQALCEAEPVAWRYTDARGHYRYRGFRPGFDAEYSILRPEALIPRPSMEGKP